MKGQRRGRSRSRRLDWRWLTMGGVAVVLVATGLVSWPWRTEEAATGTPRLAVDRTEVNLGTLPFERPAFAMFTLTNVGDGVLRVFGPPLVKAIQGC